MLPSFNTLIKLFNPEKKDQKKEPLLSYNCDIDNMTPDEVRTMVLKNNGETNNSDLKLMIGKNSGRTVYWLIK
jgi:hypothetical protein